jgi:hypothetical protein
MPDGATPGWAVGVGRGGGGAVRDVDGEGDTAGFAADVWPKIASLMAEKMLMGVSFLRGRETPFYARTACRDRNIECRRAPSETRVQTFPVATSGHTSSSRRVKIF